LPLHGTREGIADRGEASVENRYTRAMVAARDYLRISQGCGDRWSA
jgi:hypothetical protein